MKLSKAQKEVIETPNCSNCGAYAVTLDNKMCISMRSGKICGGKIKFVVRLIPKKICYCGSLRFIEKFKDVEYQSVIDGNIALLPCCMFVDIERKFGADSDYKKKADELHKRKIDICDEVCVLNVGGYIGESTKSEIDYAIKIGKPVKYLEPR